MELPNDKEVDCKTNSLLNLIHRIPCKLYRITRMYCYLSLNNFFLNIYLVSSQIKQVHLKEMITYLFIIMSDTRWIACIAVKVV